MRITFVMMACQQIVYNALAAYWAQLDAHSADAAG